MSTELPDFETLKEMAEKDPAALEKLRETLVEELITSSPVEYQRRLRGLQFHVDMERRRASNPLSSCLRISKMMHDSLVHLRDTITPPDDQPSSLAEEPANRSAKVLPFDRSAG